jgi:hypothetical protein
MYRLVALTILALLLAAPATTTAQAVPTAPPVPAPYMLVNVLNNRAQNVIAQGSQQCDTSGTCTPSSADAQMLKVAVGGNQYDLLGDLFFIFCTPPSRACAVQQRLSSGGFQKIADAPDTSTCTSIGPNTFTESYGGLFSLSYNYGSQVAALLRCVTRAAKWCWNAGDKHL